MFIVLLRPETCTSLEVPCSALEQIQDRTPDGAREF